MSSTDKTKLNGIESGAEKNVNCIKTIQFGSSTNKFTADSAGDTVSIPYASATQSGILGATAYGNLATLVGYLANLQKLLTAGKNGLWFDMGYPPSGTPQGTVIADNKLEWARAWKFRLSSDQTNHT